MRNHKLANRTIDFILNNVNNYYIDDLYSIINSNEYENQNINNILTNIINILNIALNNNSSSYNIDREILRRNIFDLISTPNGIECCLKITNHYMT
jgi:hypothetical protein